MADVAEFLDALRRVAAGGTALDPEVVAQLLVRRGGDPCTDLTQRERDVLAMMAEGRSNAEIGAALTVTDSAVSKHINSIFSDAGLPSAGSPAVKRSGKLASYAYCIMRNPARFPCGS